MFEQQKLKSDHKDQIDETSGRAKGLLDNAKLLVEDLKMKVDLEMKVDKEVGDTKKEADFTQQDVDKTRQQLEETAVEPYMEHIKPTQSTSEPLSLLSLATPALEPKEDFIVRTVFSKCKNVEEAKQTWEERLKEAKAKLKMLTIVKMIAVHEVNYTLC